jgi:hypothetical protein
MQLDLQPEIEPPRMMKIKEQQIQTKTKVLGA